MAAVDAGFEHTIEGVHRMATDMSSANKSAEGLSGTFRQAALQFVGIEKIANLALKMIERTNTWQSIETAINAKNLSRLGLRTREINLDNEIINLQSRLNTATGTEAELHRMNLMTLTAERDVLFKQKLFAEEMNRIGHARLTVLLAFKAAAIDMFIKEREMNQNLIEANSAYSVRGRLIHETLLAQTQLGISFGDITASARALVHYGLDTEASFSENVRLVAMMHQGLGVSVSESARLATIVERQVGGSFKHVADIVSQLVNDTALAGDEATKLAESIGLAMGRLRPGMGAQSLPEVLKLVGRYESALKEVGGAPGAFQQLIEGLTRPEGMLGAGALQVNPEFIATSQGVQMVMDRFAKYGENLLGQSTGWQRQMQLQNLAEQFHVSADQANQMLMAIRRARNAQTEQISTQDRWREQLHATNSGITRLANSLIGLLTGAMYPVSFAVAAITNTVADWVEKLLSYKEVVYGIGIGLLAGFVGLTGSMVRLGITLWDVVAASNFAAAGLARLSAATAASGGTGIVGTLVSILRPTAGWWTLMTAQFSALRIGLGGASFMGGWTSIATWLRGMSSTGSGILRVVMWIPRLLGVLLSPLGLLVGIIAGGLAYLGFKINQAYQEVKRLREESKELQMINVSKARELAEKRDARIFNSARDLRPSSEVLAQYRQKAQDILNMGLPATMTRAKLDEAAQQTIDAIDKGVTSKLTFKPLSERTPDEQKNADELLGLTGDIRDVNKNALQESIKKRRLQEDMERENEIERLKNRSVGRKVLDFGGDNLWGGWVGEE